MPDQIDWKTALTLDFAEGVPTFPFTEDENCNITGYGHQDKATFAAEVNRYDQAADPDGYSPEDAWAADDIAHQWVVQHPTDDERLVPVSEGTEGAVPVTALWGAR
ncbi:hypothetical protein [Pimelobacter simplex]|uniref:hypothetical protein n=1 Tax=Nocardioides simplex TaxID=2045 RepID=UPI003AAEA354